MNGRAEGGVEDVADVLLAEAVTERFAEGDIG